MRRTSALKGRPVFLFSDSPRGSAAFLLSGPWPVVDEGGGARGGRDVVDMCLFRRSVHAPSRHSPRDLCGNQISSTKSLAG